MRYRQSVHIDGNSLDDLFRLPCVYGIRKDSKADFVIHLFGDTHNGNVKWGDCDTAEIGDWLCEDYEGRWHCLKDEEYKKTAICEK